MKRKILNNYSFQLQTDSIDNQNSEITLKEEKSNRFLPPLKSTIELQHDQKSIVSLNKKQRLDHAYKENYQPAKYSKALQYRNSRSYLKKLPNGQYKAMDLFGDASQLSYFGLGTYLYIQFFRRMSWLFFIFSIIVLFTIVINWKGSGMSSYASSFSTYLIKSTIGNYSHNMVTSVDGYIVSIVPALNYLIMFIFYLVWKAHFAKSFKQQQMDKDDIKPQKFCLQIEGLDENQTDQDELNKFFSTFGPVYEVCLIKRYKDKLSYFEQLQLLQEQIKQEELQVILGGGNKERLGKLKQEKQQLQKYISTLKIEPKTISAFVHFQFQKSKADCLDYFHNYYLYSNCSSQCMRNCCCCCIDQPQAKYLFKGEKLMIKNERVPAPDDINWVTFQINLCGRFLRGFIAFLIILIFLGITCSIIGLCSIYIASHASNCQNIIVPSTLAEAQASTDSTAVQCYCDANLVSTVSDSAVKSLCESYLTNIYVSQTIQYAVIVGSSLTNFLFGLVVDKLVSFVRPASKSSGLLTKTTIYTFFLIFNTILIPLLVYADIFGFKPSDYISFVTIISADVKNFFSVTNISFYPSFNTVWYRNVSVIYVNFLIINTGLVWLFFVIDKCTARKGSIQKDQGKILQKHMNEQMTEFKLDVYKEAANLYLTIIMCGLFCVGIPVLIPLGFLNILSRYIVNRSLLQYNSSRIYGLGQEFVSLTIAIFPFILIFAPLIGQWMLIGNSDIYPNNLAMSFPYLKGNFDELDRQLYIPIYLGLSIIAFFQFFCYNTFVRCISCICNICYEKKEVDHAYHTRPFSEYAKGMNILYSYNIKNNDEKRNVILNLEKYLISNSKE